MDARHQGARTGDRAREESSRIKKEKGHSKQNQHCGKDPNIYQRLFAFYFLLYGFGGDISWFNIVPILALIAISSMLPISFGGLGIREGVMVSTLLVVGIDYDVAISVAAANLLVLWSKSAVGLCIFITCGTKKEFIEQQEDG